MFENNQGLEFEQVIEWANMQYYERGQAVIQKIPTPWKVERHFDMVTNTNKVVSAFPEKKSTVDFGGTAQGYAVWFDAKTTKHKTSFPISNVKEHQIEFLKRVHEQGGRAFLLIYNQADNVTWLLWIQDLLKFMEDNTRKSLPFSWLNEVCPKIGSSEGIVLDYLPEVIKGR